MLNQREARGSERKTMSENGGHSSIEGRPKRRVKPVVKLNYDEPGSSRDQTITIIHGGITIKIGT